MPRYTSEQTKKGLEKAILEQLRKRFGQDEKTLPAASAHYAGLTPDVLKDVKKIRSAFSTASAKNSALGEIVGLHQIDVPHMLSRLANPDGFENFRPDIQKEFGQATGKLTFLGLLAEEKGKAPVFFLLYGDDDGLRAYMPKKGNALGGKSLQDQFDVEAIKKDIQSRFHYVSDTGLSFLPDAKLAAPPARKPAR